MIYFFELIHPITQPKTANEVPKKAIPIPRRPISSRTEAPNKATINPGAIKYSGFSFNNFFTNYDLSEKNLM